MIVTDVRYWHRSTGAEERINVMVRHLLDCGFDVVTVLATTLADAASGTTVAAERGRIRQLGLHVISLFEDWKPAGLWPRIVWEIKCTVNWLRGGTRRRKSSGDPSTRYLADFAVPFLKPRFAQVLRQIDPDAVIAEYVTLAYLIPESGNHGKPLWLVDTHDLLSERYRQFARFAHEHWIRISPEEEAAALAGFDVVIAIQPHEAEAFRQMAPESVDVIVAGHPAESIPESVAGEAARYDFGYFGSDNASNVDAIQWFLQQVWPQVIADNPQATCLLAGTICRSLDSGKSAQPGIQLQPTVSDRSELYESFRVAINPVRFGTGLKIKNQEAIAHGKPLIVSAQGAEGMTTGDTPDPWIVFETADDMARHMTELGSDPSLISKTSTASLHYARKHLTPEIVYADLVRKLHHAALTGK